jgi:uncharacterized membrane protein
MTAFFILLLMICVATLVFGVGKLRERVQELERLMENLSRRVRQVEAPPRAAEPPPVATAAPVAPAAPVETPRPSVQEAMHGMADEAPSDSWNKPPPVLRPAPASVLTQLIRGYFTGGNLIVRVGIIVLFFGVAFLLKYASEHTHISIQVRLIGVAVGAAVLFALGWRLRQRRRGFALALQGGSIGVIYLTLFAALRLYQLVSPDVTFALMAALGVASSLLAIRQDSLAMSVLGATGGFLAPVLASTGQGSHVVLFSYYALLDLGIVAQAWFKAWRPLNLLAFAFTFGIGAAWGVLKYNPAQFATTEPFLLFFFLAFIAIAVLFAFRRAPLLTHYVDGTLVFGTPLAAIVMQMGLVRDIPHGRAMSALGAGAIYLVLAAWLHRTRRDTLRLLMESFLALGVAFLTLAVPLWLDDSWTASTWALEGAAMFWIGLRQQRRLSVFGGVLLQVAAAVTFVGLVQGVVISERPVANAPFMSALFISVAGLLSARCAAQPSVLLKSWGQRPANLFLTWGLGWWLYTSAHELWKFLPHHWLPGALLTLCAFTALACALLVKPLAWPSLRVPALSILPIMIAAAASWSVLNIAHPSGEGGWFAWPAAFMTLWCGLWRNEDVIDERPRAWMHGIALWMLSVLVSWELSWQMSRLADGGTAWATAVWGLVPAALLEYTTNRSVGKVWPVKRHPHEARGPWALGFAVLIAGWCLWQCFSSNGRVTPLPYLPLLNPLDIAVGVSLFAVARWLRAVSVAQDRLFSPDQQRLMISALVAIIFICLNAVLLRSMHHWRHVPYQLDTLLTDTSVHTALSIFWTILALGAMLWANRSLQRVVWFCGATLMAVVVIKLFMVDLARIGTVPRIVSFLVVGGLMLVIGYFSPLPPNSDNQSAARAN